MTDFEAVTRVVI